MKHQIISYFLRRWAHLSEHKNLLYLTPLNICSSFFNFPFTLRTFATLHPHSPQFLTPNFAKTTLQPHTHLPQFLHSRLTSHSKTKQVKILLGIHYMMCESRPKGKDKTNRSQAMDQVNLGQSRKGLSCCDLHWGHPCKRLKTPEAGNPPRDRQLDDPLPLTPSPATIASSADGSSLLRPWVLKNWSQAASSVSSLLLTTRNLEPPSLKREYSSWHFPSATDDLRRSPVFKS